MTTLYIAAIALTLARLLWIRWPYRAFLVAMVCWLGQAVNVAYARPVREWTAFWWAPGEAMLLAATAWAVWESIGRERDYVPRPFRRWQLGVSCMAIPACLVGFGEWFLPTQGDWLARFVIARAWIWAFLVLALVVAKLLLALEEVLRPAIVRRHGALLLAVVGVHALASWWTNAPDGVWWDARAVVRAATIAACMGWATARTGCETERSQIARGTTCA
jgi:hypothetical protein